MVSYTCTSSESANANYTWYRWAHNDTLTSYVTWDAWNDNLVNCGEGTTSTWYSFVTSTEKVKHYASAPQKKTRRQVLEKQNRDIIDGEMTMYRMSEIYRKRAEAEIRAEDLLVDLIGEDQRAVYRRTGRLLIKGKQHDYLLSKRRENFSGVQVQKIVKDKIVDLCIHFKDRNKYPMSDQVIALALFAKNDENGFDDEANVICVNPFMASENKALLECAVM